MQKIKDFLYYNRKDVIIVIFFLLLFALYTIVNSSDNCSSEVVSNIIQDEIKEDSLSSNIVIDIKGEINNPGTYEIKDGDRVIDVVNLAGGFTSDADTSKINLSEKLSDEMLIYIPKIGDNNEIVSESKSESVSDSKVSINSGTLEELMTIKGIGLTKAQNIIEYRKKMGKFKSIEEITYVSGIGKATFEKIKDYIKI